MCYKLYSFTTVHMATIVTYIILLQVAFLKVYCITVDVEHRPPNIMYPNEALTLYKQKVFTVQCRATGIPQPTYQWKVGDQEAYTPGVSSIDSTTGVLTFNDFSPREEGQYRCYASNYVDIASGRKAVTSLSPPLTILFIRIEPPSVLPQYTLTGTEYDYIKIPCGSDKFTAVAEIVHYNWFQSGFNTEISLDGGRLYIDKLGDLHITYLIHRDARSTTVKCGLSVGISLSILFGNAYYIQVTSGSSVAVPPQRRYKSDGTKGLIGRSAKLECIFSG